MRLAVDALPLLSTFAGIAHYTREPMQRVAQTPDVDTFYYCGLGWDRILRECPVPHFDTIRKAVKSMVPQGRGMFTRLRQTFFSIGARDVHFLKIDVEGREEKVLRGNVWSRERPWIVLVEATRPESQVDSYGAWELILYRADYCFAYADGLNRFYFAKEHSELLPSFVYPPNVFDDFKLNGQHQAELRARRAENDLEAIRQSCSWRITKPLRWLETVLSQILHK